MAKKRKVSKKKVTKFIIFLILIIGIVLALIFFLSKDSKKEEPIKVTSVDEIKGYDYTLNSNATKYYKSLFKELKEVLEAKDIDEAKYADLVTKLFVSDFYNLDNKINKNDIGGVQFIYKPFREDFTKLATDSIYKNVLNNMYEDRDQELPIVTNVSTEKKDNKEFKYGDKTDENAYNIGFEIEYQKDLEYQTAGTLILIHSDKKLEVAALEEPSSN